MRNIPPFPFVKESLVKLTEKADAIVVSQTPLEALLREWDEYGISGYVRDIAGQEMGTKTEHLSFAARGKYEPEKMLMIGDAPGDYKAAKANNALFFPIIPGHEEGSWKLFFDPPCAGKAFWPSSDRYPWGACHLTSDRLMYQQRLWQAAKAPDLSDRQC